MPPDEHVRKLVRDWRWFSYVPEEAVDWIVERIQMRHFDAGSLVYLADEPVKEIYGVLRGTFQIFIDTTVGMEITLEEAVPGTWFAHFVPAERPVHSASCICRQDAVVAAVALPDLNEFAIRWPGYYQGMYHEFMDRVEVILGRIELLSCHTLDVRLAVYLVRMAHLRGESRPDGTIWIPTNESQGEIGSRVGGARQRVNATILKWVSERILDAQKHGFLILDMGALRHEATKSGFELDAYLASGHGSWGGKAPSKAG